MSIVLLHGFLGHPNDWDDVRVRLNCESIALTLPGHVDEKMVDDVVDHVHGELKESAQLLVGYSAGGRLALALKDRYPKSYGSVIAFSAHPGQVEDREKRRKEDRFWASRLRNEPLENVVDDWYLQPLFEGLTVNRSHRLCHNPKELALFLERFSVAAIPAPKLYPATVFVYGERDLKYKTLYHTLPSHINVEAVALAGHALHLENPQACAKIIGAAYEHLNNFKSRQLARDSKV